MLMQNIDVSFFKYAMFVTCIITFYLTSQCFHVPYSALTMFLSTNQHERDSATAYRKHSSHTLKTQCLDYMNLWGYVPKTHACILFKKNIFFMHVWSAGMTVEVLGTLVGAAIQGQIVASAHTMKHCPHHNLSAGHLGNSSGMKIIRTVGLSHDFLFHAVRVSVTSVLK